MKNVLFEDDLKCISISTFPQKKDEMEFWLNNTTEKDKLILICNTFLTPQKLKEFKSLNYYEKCIFICNSKLEKKYCDDEKVFSCFINKICLLNENLFFIDENIKKDLLGIYSTSFSNRKRLNICKDINNISLLLDYKNGLPEFFNGINTINENTIEIFDLYKYYNRAQFGVSLITQDSSSYVIGEYFLCGLPIITVASIGGKNIWTNKYNSVLVDATKESILKGIELCLTNIENGMFNSEMIRRRQLILMNDYRKKFIKFLSTLTSLSESACEIILNEEIINKNHLLRS